MCLRVWIPGMLALMSAVGAAKSACVDPVRVVISFGQLFDRFEEWVIVSKLLDAERELHVGRTAVRASVPPVVFERPFMTAGATPESGQRYSPWSVDGGTSAKVSVSRS
jgi:hypothetical protein